MTIHKYDDAYAEKHGKVSQKIIGAVVVGCIGWIGSVVLFALHIISVIIMLAGLVVTTIIFLVLLMSVRKYTVASESVLVNYPPLRQ